MKAAVVRVVPELAQCNQASLRVRERRRVEPGKTFELNPWVDVTHPASSRARDRQRYSPVGCRVDPASMNARQAAEEDVSEDRSTLIGIRMRSWLCGPPVDLPRMVTDSGHGATGH
jgi:hypothetical protein